jgi:two-component system, NtrC family, response regulator GlrR
MTNNVNMVLLNASRSSGILTDLRLILESSRHPCIQFVDAPIQNWETGVLDHSVSQILSTQKPNVLILVLDSEQFEGAGTLFPLLKKAAADVPVLVVTDTDQPENLWQLLRLGIDDFIIPPLNQLSVLPRLWRLMDTTTEEEGLIQRLKEKLGLHQFVGKNPAFVEELQKIPVVAKYHVGVLISGETGTGKELIARAIHYLSPQGNKPFVPVHCGAIPAELAENELFGHEQGAFTGAHSRQLGLIQEANEGTIFFDDVDCLPLSVQMKLLRFLQEKEYRRLGSAQRQIARVRVLAASNTSLAAKVASGDFRQDLYYRLKIVTLHLPPLRQRPEDILPLAQHFLVKYATEFEKPVAGFSEAALQKLCVHNWPGNVRELENVIASAVILCNRSILTEQDLVLSHNTQGIQESYQQAKKKVVEEFDKRYVQALLALHKGNISKAASAAQKNRRAFWAIVRKHNIDVQRFKL